jgi:hypothetical protein
MSEEQLELLQAALKALSDFQKMSGTRSATFELAVKSVERCIEVDA